MEKKLRYITFNNYLDSYSKWSGIRKHEGYFHQWGKAYIDDFEITVGVVEDLTGKVFLAAPAGMIFKDPYRGS